MFVTCFYAILDPESGRLSYANAGHDLLTVARSCRGAKGQGDAPGPYARHELRGEGDSLKPGDSALFYSDGLVEAHDPEGEMFGFPRLRALVAEHGEEERSLVDSLLEELTPSLERAGSRRTT